MTDEIQKIFPANIRPLAQVTMVDAAEGDCNLVDFCMKPPIKTKVGGVERWEYPPDAWYRCLIDTGPSSNSAGIVPAVSKLIGKLRVPAFPGGHETEVPKLDEFQITHFDDDHIGNAKALLDDFRVKHKKQITGTKFVYTPIPRAYVAPRIMQGRPDPRSDGGQEFNYVEFRAVLPLEKAKPTWEEMMQAAGFKVRVILRSPDNYSLEENNAIWEGKNAKDLSRFTLRYSKDAVTNKFQPRLYAMIELLQTEDSDLKVNLSKKQKARFRYPDAGYSIIKLQEWVTDLPEKKKSKTSRNVDNQPLPMVLRPAPWVNPPTPFPLPGADEDDGTLSRPIRKLPQLLLLHEYIAEVNKQKDNCNWQVSIPTADEVVTRYKGEGLTKKRLGSRTTIGPSEQGLQKMMQHVILKRYEADATATRILPDDGSLNADIINRSSTVTLFERHDKGNEFTMLFTGDAFDMECDIRDTLVSWRPNMAPRIYLDVLKVPHHGSNRTATAGFYSTVRAEVYLICGSHQLGGNPKVSTLRAIIETFKGRKKPGDRPFFIFFSNPRANLSSNVRASPVSSIMKSNLKPTGDSGDYHYEMYHLQKKSDSAVADAFGTILFGRDNDGNLVTDFNTTNEWQKCG